MKVALAILVPLLLIAAGVAGLYRSGYLARFLGGANQGRQVHTSRTLPHPPSSRPSGGRSMGIPSISGVANAPAIRQISPAPKSPKSSPADGLEADQKLSKLAAIYEAMPPDDAAKVLPALPDALLVQILRRMDERVAARTLAALDRKRAVRLSLALAR
ncbi:MAG: MotE family protein [Chthonomonadales bacterium]